MVEARVERRTPPWVGGFPEIAVDRDPASPNYGTVYIGYNWLGAGRAGPDSGCSRLRTSAGHGRPRRSLRPVAARVPRLVADRVSPSTCTGRERVRDLVPGRPSPLGSARTSSRRAGRATWVDWASRSRGSVRTGEKTFDVGRSRIAARVRETAFTTAGRKRVGHGREHPARPDVAHGFDVDPATGSLYLAVAVRPRPRSALRGERSRSAGATTAAGPGRSRACPRQGVGGRRQSSIRHNLVAGAGYVLVTFHTLDDVGWGATIGAAFAVSRDGGVTWRHPAQISRERWRAANLGASSTERGCGACRTDGRRRRLLGIRRRSPRDRFAGRAGRDFRDEESA